MECPYIGGLGCAQGVYFQPAGKSGADGLFQSRPCGIPGIAAKDDDPRCLSAAGIPVCVLHGKSGQHPDDQSAGKAAGAWDFAVCGNDRKAGFPYADRRMPVVRRGYGIFVSWHWRNPGLDF